MWLECIGVVSGCYKEVYRFPHNKLLLIHLPLVLALFCSSITTSLFIFKCFSFFFLLFLCNIANVVQRTFEIVKNLNYANKSI